MTRFRGTAGSWPYLHSLWSLALSALLLPAIACAEETASAQEYQVKAAFLFNFAKYGDWPADALSDAPFDICLLETPKLTGILTEKLLGRRLQDREVRVLPLNTEKFAGCHVLFISAAVSDKRSQLLMASVAKQAVLLVGESPRFLEDGGAISFYVSDGTVHFDVNLDHIRERGLKISSKLLRHAGKIIGTQELPANTGATP